MGAPPSRSDVETDVLRPGVDYSVRFSGIARLDWSDASGPRSRELTKSTVVGSSPNAQLIINDSAVSRLHAQFERSEGGGVWIRDLQSTNGTWVQGVRVERALVPHMGRIRLGQTDLVLTYIHDAAANEDSEELWPEPRFGGLVGGSRKMRALYAMLARVAKSDAPVLIVGETGTGKEVVAQAVHEASARQGRPFVVVDCAALPETLLDAELFGHARGAFTGAANARPGAIESANGGTVFLDEIGELPKGMQPKLLRVLEAKTVRRLGENEHRPVDVRFVFATHRDLLKMVSTGDFREDLYFRLSVLQVCVPALNERLEDIDLLVSHFLGNGELIPPDLLTELRARTWQGNVRELRNFVDRMRTLGFRQALEMTGQTSSAPASVPGPGPTSTQIPPPLASPSNTPPMEGSFRSFRDRWNEHGEMLYVKTLLMRHSRNVSAAAREAQLDRTYLYKLIRKYGL